MSKNKDCWDRVKALLDAAKSSGSLTYVQSVSEGMRDLPRVNSAYPAIIMEPTNEAEENKHMTAGKKNELSIQLWCFEWVVNRDKQIAGDTANQGIMNLVNDVKNVLGADSTLNSKCIYFDFPTVVYDYDLVEFPIRWAVITMVITYLSTATTR